MQNLNKSANLFVKFFFLLLCITKSFSDANEKKEQLMRVHSHLVVHDYASACDHAFLIVQNYPEEEEAWHLYLKSLAFLLDEKALFSAWKDYVKRFPNAHVHDEVVESLAWGVLKKGSFSSFPLIRVMSLLGACFSQDAKGVKIIAKQFHDKNSLVRAVAVQLAGKFRDVILCDAILNILNRESVLSVHMQAVKAAGSMKIKEAEPYLLKLLSSDKILVEEKLYAIEALVNLKEEITKEEIIKLALSNRAGLRLLSCRVIEHLGDERDIDQLIFLLKDHNSEVRAAALQTLGSLGIKNYAGKPITEYVINHLNEGDPIVAISAAWVLLLHDPIMADSYFRKWISHPDSSIRLLAAAALSGSGKNGVGLSLSFFQSHKDLYVRMNLACGLIGQRIAVVEACDVLNEGVAKLEEKWMWKEIGRFRALMPLEINETRDALTSPEAVNQLAHLEILNLMAMLNYPKTEQAIIDFLQNREWGISGGAAVVLLTECDDSAIAIVKNLLNHSNQHIRIQAALILAMWGKDEAAISVLTQAYAIVDKNMKERILEGLGNIGARSTLPFLVERLGESSQSLRLIAASAILQTLYN